MATTVTRSNAVELTDPGLISKLEQRTKSFTEAQQIVEKSLPEWNKTLTELKAYNVKVNNAASDLQHGRVVVPQEEGLLQTQEKYLVEYWDFHAICDKIDTLASSLKTLIQTMKPERSQSLKIEIAKDLPELVAQINHYDEVSKRYFDQLVESRANVKKIQQEYVKYVKGDVGWTVQRFCQIVTNKGQPISISQRFGNNVSWTVQWPDVPKPKQNEGEPTAKFVRDETKTTKKPSTRQLEEDGELFIAVDISDDEKEPQPTFSPMEGSQQVPTDLVKEIEPQQHFEETKSEDGKDKLKISTTTTEVPLQQSSLDETSSDKDKKLETSTTPVVSPEQQVDSTEEPSQELKEDQVEDSKPKPLTMSDGESSEEEVEDRSANDVSSQKPWSFLKTLFKFTDK